MRIPRWRLVLTFGAGVVLAVGGMGLVAAASSPAPPASSPGSVAATASPSMTSRPERPRAERLERRAPWGARLLRLGRHVVHVEATVADRDDQLITVWIDHGTVQSVADGSVTISEKGGGTQVLKTDGETIVHVGREDGSLDDVKAGAEVFVQSRVVDGSPIAKRILVIPAKPN